MTDGRLTESVWTGARDPFAGCRISPGFQPHRLGLYGKWEGTATGALVQCSPACHGKNLHSAAGERVFVPGFPYPPGSDEPFPRLETPVRIRQPYQEVQRQIVHFFTSHRDTGQAEIRSYWTPVLDWDDDGLADERENALGTDFSSPDTDSDGISDGDETEHGWDPLDAGDPPA